MEMKSTLVKGYHENAQLRKSFIDLSKETFGLDFEDWYQNGYWKDNYIPYSIQCDGEIAANVSVNPMEFIYDGKKINVIQLGTVMTKEIYRNRGLSRRLMEEIQKDYADVDGAFLFGNDSVLEFYPKFGFEKSEEFQYFKDLKTLTDGISQKQTAILVPMKEKKDWEKLEAAIKESCCSGRLGMYRNVGLIMFYITKFMQECVYRIEDLDVWVIAEPEDDTLFIHEVIGSEEVDLEKVIASFGKTYKRVSMGFVPENTDGWQIAERKEEDCTLFVKGEVFEDFAQKKVMFPTLAHA